MNNRGIVDLPNMLKPNGDRLTQTYIDLAAMCLDVYGDNGPTVPSTWSLYATSTANESGYVGACYTYKFRNSDDELRVMTAFAHRGTVLSLSHLFTAVENLVGDLEVALGMVPYQYLDALEFVTNTTNKLIGQFGKDAVQSVFQTGHSLGAIISDLLCAKGLSVYSFTFENPGSSPIVNSMISQGWLPATALDNLAGGAAAYLSDINIVNTCNAHGPVKTYWMKIGYDFNALNNAMAIIPSNWLANLNYLYYSLNQHKMEKIYNYLLVDGKVEEARYPVGFRESYAAYLNPARAAYWRNYALTIWQIFPEIHKPYNDNFEEYFVDFNKSLTKTWQEANSTPAAISGYNQFGLLRAQTPQRKALPENEQPLLGHNQEQQVSADTSCFRCTIS